MITPQFTSLQSNFFQIYKALQASKKNEDLPLIGSSPYSVICQGSFLDQLTNSISQIWHALSFTPTEAVSWKKPAAYILTTLFDHAAHQVYDERQKHLLNHIQRINNMWEVDALPEQRQRYGDFLSKELEGSREAESPLYLYHYDKRKITLWTEDEERNHRHLMVEFQEATAQFWPLFIKKNESPEALKKSLLPLLTPFSILKDKALYRAIKKESNWIEMEGIMKESIPIELLSKIGGLSELSSKDNRRLNLWIEALNEQHERLSLKLCASVFREIIEIIRLQGSSKVTLQDLLYWLEQRGCEFLKQEDEEHMIWHEGLQRRDHVSCNGLLLKLGSQLSPDSDEDVYKVFELADFPHYVVKIANNRFRLLIEDKQSKIKEEHWGFRFVETISNISQEKGKQISGLDSQGRCSVIEKLSSSFDAHEWTSEHHRLNERDEALALNFANHLYFISLCNATPQNFSLSHLMLSSEGVIKSVKILKKGPPNYNEWEDACIKAAKENRHVLRFLMNVSKLKDHKIANHYLEAVSHTLKTGKTDLIGRLLPLGHQLDCYEKQTADLCAQAQAIRKACLKKIKSLLSKKKAYSIKDKKKIEEAVANRLVKCYQSSATPGRLSSELAAEVIQSFSTKSQSPSLGELPVDYYREKQQEMIKGKSMHKNQNVMKRSFV